VSHKLLWTSHELIWINESHPHMLTHPQTHAQAKVKCTTKTHTYTHVHIHTHANTTRTRTTHSLSFSLTHTTQRHIQLLRRSCYCNTLQHTATYTNTHTQHLRQIFEHGQVFFDKSTIYFLLFLHHTAKHTCSIFDKILKTDKYWWWTCTICHTFPAAHCNILQHTKAHCNTHMQHLRQIFEHGQVVLDERSLGVIFFPKRNRTVSTRNW
jgi:hypothetical protein